MRRRGFTLIEVSIVLVIMGIITTGYYAMYASIYREFASLSMTSSLKTECDRAGACVTRVAAEGGAFHLDPDNHGARFARGQRIRWYRGGLRVTESGHTRVIVLPSVDDVCLLRSGSILLVDVSVRGAQTPGGPSVQSIGRYSYPEAHP